MLNSYNKILSILLYILLAIGLVFALLFYFGPPEPLTAGTPLEVPRVTDSMLTAAYIFVIIAAISAIAFPLGFMIIHPAKAKFVLLGVGVFALILFIAYLLGNSSPLPKVLQTGDIASLPAKSMKLVDGGLKATYIFLGLTFLGIIYTEVSSIFR